MNPVSETESTQCINLRGLDTLGRLSCINWQTSFVASCLVSWIQIISKIHRKFHKPNQESKQKELQLRNHTDTRTKKKKKKKKKKCNRGATSVEKQILREYFRSAEDNLPYRCHITGNTYNHNFCDETQSEYSSKRSSLERKILLTWGANFGLLDETTF